MKKLLLTAAFALGTLLTTTAQSNPQFEATETSNGVRLATGGWYVANTLDPSRDLFGSVEYGFYLFNRDGADDKAWLGSYIFNFVKDGEQFDGLALDINLIFDGDSSSIIRTTGKIDRDGDLSVRAVDGLVSALKAAKNDIYIQVVAKNGKEVVFRFPARGLAEGLNRLFANMEAQNGGGSSGGSGNPFGGSSAGNTSGNPFGNGSGNSNSDEGNQG